MSESTVEITAGNFKETVEKNSIVFVDWWAPWCGPCKTFAPIYANVAANHPDVVFCKINTEDQPELAMEFGIQSIPTVMIFRDRILLFSQPGAMNASSLENLVKQAKELDMDEVRQKLEAREKANRS